MQEEDNGLYFWLRLVLTPGIGGENQRKLLKAFGLPREIFAASLAELAETVGEKNALALKNFDQESSVEKAMLWSEKPDCYILTIADEKYPTLLLDTIDPPTLIYVRGQLETLNKPSLAIVGSRNATPQGLNTTRQFAKELAEKSGMVIVSGLALGIDQEAHRGALEGNGYTIAVLGTGVDRVYPVNNRSLALNIIEKGVVISEFPLGTPPIGSNFPRRNRIISGLSLGVLVIEAAINSGSLITARLAAEQGRDVFAIPGSIQSPVSKGCHKLIRDGAKLVEKVDDIIEEIRLKTAIHKPIDESSIDQKGLLILNALGHANSSLDDLVLNTKLSAEELLPILLSLEMDNLIATLPGNQFQRL